LSASQTQHRATLWTDKRGAQQAFGALLDVQTRWQQWTGRFALVGDPLWQDNALPNIRRAPLPNLLFTAPLRFESNTPDCKTDHLIAQG
ncbi:MAG: hypothetical protein ACRC8O_06420, partial [Plesiomonas shigelloides]